MGLLSFFKAHGIHTSTADISACVCVRINKQSDSLQKQASSKTCQSKKIYEKFYMLLLVRAKSPAVGKKYQFKIDPSPCEFCNQTKHSECWLILKNSSSWHAAEFSYSLSRPFHRMAKADIWLDSLWISRHLHTLVSICFHQICHAISH